MKSSIQINLGESERQVASSESGHVCAASLITGEGTIDFVESFASALKSQLVFSLWNEMDQD